MTEQSATEAGEMTLDDALEALDRAAHTISAARRAVRRAAERERAAPRLQRQFRSELQNQFRPTA